MEKWFLVFVLLALFVVGAGMVAASFWPQIQLGLYQMEQEGEAARGTVKEKRDFDGDGVAEAEVVRTGGRIQAVLIDLNGDGKNDFFTTWERDGRLRQYGFHKAARSARLRIGDAVVWQNEFERAGPDGRAGRAFVYTADFAPLLSETDWNGDGLPEEVYYFRHYQAVKAPDAAGAEWAKKIRQHLGRPAEAADAVPAPLPPPAEVALPAGIPARPCTAEDVVGTWDLVELRVGGRDQSERMNERFLYSPEGTVRHVASKNPISEQDIQLMESLPGSVRYRLDPRGLMTLSLPETSTTPFYTGCACATGAVPERNVRAGDLLLTLYGPGGEADTVRTLRRVQGN